MSRDLRLDALRGLLLVAMTADHVSRFKAPSIGLSGYVTPAEGFVFISGLVAGMVYGKAAATRPFGELRGKAFRRALVVYGTQFSVYLFVLVLFLLTGGWGGHWTPLAPLFGTSPALSVLLGGTLLYQPSHFDILPMYVPFLVLTPYAVRACLGGKSSVVWLASFSVYVLAQLEIPKRLLLAATVPLPVNTGFFDPFAWQLLFFAGLCLSAGAAAGGGIASSAPPDPAGGMRDRRRPALRVPDRIAHPLPERRPAPRGSSPERLPAPASAAQFRRGRLPRLVGTLRVPEVRDGSSAGVPRPALSPGLRVPDASRLRSLSRFRRIRPPRGASKRSPPRGRRGRPFHPRVASRGLGRTEA